VVLKDINKLFLIKSKNMDISQRSRLLNNITRSGSGPVIYWMSRDQRAANNWALLYAQSLAENSQNELWVVFSLTDNYPGSTLRTYHFLLSGLVELQENLANYNIPFFLLTENPEHSIPEFIKQNKASTLVTDFDPLAIKRKWKQTIASKIEIPFYEVDAHNIVPCWDASPKQEFGAYTLRPKLKKLLPDYLTPFPGLKRQTQFILHPPALHLNDLLAKIVTDRSVLPCEWIKPGEREAQTILSNFIETKLDNYENLRNDPNNDATSRLSPYLHFGQISAQQIAIEVIKSSCNETSKEAFLEELIIRRELSDNFCYYNPNYDNPLGFADWSKRTHEKHKTDTRDNIYTLIQFENFQTHEELWNAAQKQLVNKGFIHGYMRMYWAKKILEWSSSTAEALHIANYLNDKYALDGRDPNGYTGTAWSIGGVHDRAWAERNVFGNIRYMNENGCRRKFDVQKYITAQNTFK